MKVFVRISEWKFGFSIPAHETKWYNQYLHTWLHTHTYTLELALGKIDSIKNYYEFMNNIQTSEML